MKTILILVAGLLAANSYGQCTIAGDSTIKLNEGASYSVDAKAQCEDCYSWKVSSDESLKTEGHSKSRQINLIGLKIGKQIVTASVFNGQLLECSKVIDVVESNENIAVNKCRVSINDFKDVKVSDSVISFFPNENSLDYEYEWIVTYANDEVKKSTEKIPQFFFSYINYIKSVKLRINNKPALCAVSISKNYVQNYWKATANQYGNIKQKVYTQGSYNDYVKSQEKQETDNSSNNN